MRLTSAQYVGALTYWGPDKMAAISETILSKAFSWMKMLEFWLKFHWSLFPKVQLTIQALVQIMAWRQPGGKPLSEPVLVSLLMYICVTRPQWVKSMQMNYIWCAKATMKRCNSYGNCKPDISMQAQPLIFFTSESLVPMHLIDMQ